MKSIGLVLVAIGASGCTSSWTSVDVLPDDGPEAPSVLAACAAGGSVADASAAGVLCTSSTDLLGGALTDGSVVLLAGPMPFLAP